ncbi:MAG: hypothetical protein KAU20_03620 [Nanoarchaeota archaeon]|nr:hypothetical protein [Nanoarchaeota archaeon]
MNGSIIQLDKDTEEKVKKFKDGEINIQELKDYFFSQMHDYSEKRLSEKMEAVFSIVADVRKRYPEESDRLVDGSGSVDMNVPDSKFAAGVRLGCDLINQEISELK